MGFLKNWQGSRGIMRLLIIHLICWLGWLSNFAFAVLDISEGVTGSVNFPGLGITCLGNLAVFVTSLIRGRLDLEIGARDALEILVNPKLVKISGIEDGSGLTTRRGREREAAVVMLSNGKPSWSMRQFMKSNAPFVHSILLQFLPFKDGVFTVEACEGSRHACDCIVIWTVEEIKSALAGRMPQTVKPLSDSLCLLPCRECLENVCHGCIHKSLLPGEGEDEGQRLRGCVVPCRECLENVCHGCIHESLLPGEGEDEGQRLRGCVVSDILGDIRAGSIDKREPICICIPMNDASRDNWTKLLVRSLRSKDAEGRVREVRVMAWEVLEGYLTGGRGGKLEGSLKYNIYSLIVPRFTEIFINLVLTFWFRVDGFSSALVARRAVKDYLLDSKGTGFATNAFLTKVQVMCNDNNTQVCQVLSFRGNLLWIIAFISTGCVNLISFLGWAVFISFECGADSPPASSRPIVAVITAAIATAWGMDAAGLIIFHWNRGLRSRLTVILIWVAVLVFESMYIVSGIAVAKTLGIKGFGRWLYGALQILVWVKWLAGSLLLNEEISRKWGILTYSSAFLLNAVLAGVRCSWERSPWKDNHLFSRKLGL